MIEENKNLPTILNVDGIQKGEKVRYGCRSFSKSEYTNLYETMKLFKMKSYKIGAGEITFEDIEYLVKALV